MVVSPCCTDQATLSIGNPTNQDGLLFKHQLNPHFPVLLLLFRHKRHELECSKRAPGNFTLIGDKAPPTARDSSEVARS